MSAGLDPKTVAPQLLDDGTLEFESQSALVSVYDGFLSKGGLPVKPRTPLEPLAQVTVKFNNGTVEVGAQVVMIQSDVTVLRLLDSVPPAVIAMVESARNKPVASPNPFANKPKSAAPPKAAPTSTVELDVIFQDDRPTLHDDTLHFADHAHGKASEKDMFASLSIQASGSKPNATAVHLAIGDNRTDLRIDCSITEAGDDVVDIQFNDIGSLAGAFRALLVATRDAPAAKKTAPPIPESTDLELAQLDDALAAFLSDGSAGEPKETAKTESTRNAPAPAPAGADETATQAKAPSDTAAAKSDLDLDLPPAPESPATVDDLFADLPPASTSTSATSSASATPSASRALFDVPPTGTEDELAAIVDAFDASPDGMDDILDIGAPTLSMTDSIEITVSDLNEAHVDAGEAELPPSTSPDGAPQEASAEAAGIQAGAFETPAPCSLDGDTLLFTEASLAEVREGFETLGLIWAQIPDDVTIDPRQELKVRISVDGNIVDAAMRAFGMKGPPKTVLLRILDVNALAAILDAVQSSDAQESQETENAPALATLRGQSLAFSGIDELKAAKKEIESTGSLVARSLTTPPAALKLSANVSGASLGSGWPTSALEKNGRTTLKFDRPEAVLESISLFLAAFEDATGPDEAVATPTLTGHFLNFSHANLARIAASEIEEHQAILVSPTVSIVPDEKRTVRFQVADRPLNPEFEIRLQPAHDDKAIAFFSAETAEEAARLLHTSIAAPSQTVGISPSDVAEAVLQKTGRVRNPSSAAQLLEIPIAEAPRPSDIKTPSTPLLLRLLMGGTGTVHVRIRQSGSEREIEFDVVNGREVYAAVPIAKLAFSLAFQDGTYALENAKKPTPGHKQMLTVSLIGELVRALTRRITPEALETGFPNLHLSPTLTDRGTRLLEAIGLSSTQTRLAKVKFVGTENAQMLVESMRVPMLGWELFYAMEVMGGLDWIEPELQVVEDSTKDPLAAELDDLKTRDDFDALGLHWSTAPRHIDGAYERAKERFGPSSPAAKRKPDLAKPIFAHLTAAYERLKSPGSRRDYRKQTFSLNWSQQCDLMLSHAKLATYRGDMSEARDLLEGILDFHTNAEASALLKKLEKAGLV